MGKLMYAFRIAIAVVALLIFFWIFFGGMGDLIMGWFRIGQSDIYIDPASGAYLNPNIGILKLTVTQKKINEMSGIDIIFYNEDGSTFQHAWTGSLKESSNVLYFDLNGCPREWSRELSLSMVDDNVKSVPTRHVEVRDDNFEVIGAVYDLCSVCESGSGDGNRNNPKILCTCEELQNVSSALETDFALGNAIDCTGFEFITIGDDVRPFRGSLNGRGYSIYGLRIKQGEDYAGLFGVLFDGEIENLGLVHGSVSGNLYVGSLVGRQEEGTVRKSYVEDFRVNGKANVGGLIGYSNGEVIECYSQANVTASVFGGGLIGGFQGKLKDSYSVGRVDSIYNGFIGKTFEGYIIENSYYNTDLFDYINNANGFGRTTSEMKKAETFKGWNFNSIWDINEGLSYPTLR